MSCRRLPALVAAVLGWAAVPCSAQSINLQFHDGLVTVAVQNARVSQILAEWARLGGTTFVNADRIPGEPVTLQLDNVSERQALDVLLRSVSGYMVAARETAATGGASSFDRILILPTSSAPQPSSPSFSPPPIAQPFPEFEPEILFDPGDPGANPSGTPTGPDEERLLNPRIRVPFAPPTVNGRPMPPQPFQPDPDDVPDESEPVVAPTNPFGVPPGSSRPGTITPVPEQDRRSTPPRPDPEP